MFTLSLISESLLNNSSLPRWMDSSKLTGHARVFQTGTYNGKMQILRAVNVSPAVPKSIKTTPTYKCSLSRLFFERILQNLNQTCLVNNLVLYFSGTGFHMSGFLDL